MKIGGCDAFVPHLAATSPSECEMGKNTKELKTTVGNN